MPGSAPTFSKSRAARRRHRKIVELARELATPGAAPPARRDPDSTLHTRPFTETLTVPVAWWEDAFTYTPNASEAAGHRCGSSQMLTIVAYDITDEKRLRRVAQLCEDYGVRVQYSVFECRLEADRFDDFWLALQGLLKPDEDRAVAYKVCARCAREIRAAGTQITPEKVVAYVI